MSAEENLQKILADTSTAALLNTFAHLTHLIHWHESEKGNSAAVEERAKRARVKDEILRRTGDLK